VPHPKYLRAKRKKQLRKLVVTLLLVGVCLSLLLLSLWLLNPSGHSADTPSAPAGGDTPVNFK